MTKLLKIYKIILANLTKLLKIWENFLKKLHRIIKKLQNYLNNGIIFKKNWQKLFIKKINKFIQTERIFKKNWQNYWQLFKKIIKNLSKLFRNKKIIIEKLTVLNWKIELFRKKSMNFTFFRFTEICKKQQQILK